MAVKIARGKSDKIVASIKEVLEAYQADHEAAQIDLYRQNSVCVRVRIIDPEFEGRGINDRSKRAWKYLRRLPNDVQGDLSLVLLLTPEETATSFVNHDFENPRRSNL